MKHAVSPQPRPSARNAALLRRSFLVAALRAGTAGAFTVTLYRLAQAHGTTVTELSRLNSLTGTILEVGQSLRLPGEGTPVGSAATPAAPPGVPSRSSGRAVSAPVTLRMGDAFVLCLSGPRAGQATVRFPGEVGEDARLPGGRLTPIAKGSEFLVLGLVVLGKSTPLEYEIQVGEEVVRGRIPITGLAQPLQRLNLLPSVLSKLDDPPRKAEDAAVEQAYARRTAQA